jgi:hypothetical protein
VLFIGQSEPIELYLIKPDKKHPSPAFNVTYNDNMKECNAYVSSSSVWDMKTLRLMGIDSKFKFPIIINNKKILAGEKLVVKGEARDTTKVAPKRPITVDISPSKSLKR